MAFLVESPWPVLLTGIIIEAVLGVLLLQTGRGKLLWAMIAVGVITVVGFVVERIVVTDREMIEMTIDEGARAVVADDIDRLFKCGVETESTQGLRNVARFVMQRYKVESVWITNLEITINKLTSPPTAEAKFTARGNGSDRKGEIPYPGYSKKVVLKFQKKGDRWLVTGFGGDLVVPGI